MTKSKKEKALEILCPDENGHSNIHWINEFVSRYPDLTLGNGGDWCRDDGSLGQEFIIERIKGSDEPEVYETLKTSLNLKTKNAIIGIKLNGKRKNASKQTIKKEIQEKVRKLNCSVLDIGSQIEVDHKDGRKDDSRVISVDQQEESDFQPLSKAVNMAKKTHCGRCKETGTRFDAKKLGYSVSQVFGGSEYKGSCSGCYWFDPKAFNKEISKSYIKKYEDKDILVEITLSENQVLRIKPIVLLDLKYISEDVYQTFLGMKLNSELNVSNGEKKYSVKRVQ